MANKKIPFKEKELVKHRLAKGKSYRDALEGTSISSTRTVGKIAKENAKDIKELRVEYLGLIEKYGAAAVNRAKLWAKMTKATKSIGETEAPDWQNRREALLYIDKLAGINEDTQDITAVQVVLSPEIDKLAT